GPGRPGKATLLPPGDPWAAPPPSGPGCSWGWRPQRVWLQLPAADRTMSCIRNWRAGTEGGTALEAYSWPTRTAPHSRQANGRRDRVPIHGAVAAPRGFVAYVSARRPRCTVPPRWRGMRRRSLTARPCSFAQARTSPERWRLAVL